MWLLYFFFKSYTVDENNWFYKLVNGLEIIFLSQQIFYIKASFAYPRRVVRRQQTSYAKRFPFILISNVVLSLPGRHSALSVRHIESTNRKRGSRICFEFPSSLPSFLLITHHRMLPSKTDDSDLSEGSRLRFETLAMGRWPRTSFMVFAECQISALKEWTGYCAILHHMSDVCSLRDSEYSLKKIIVYYCIMLWRNMIQYNWYSFQSKIHWR